MGHFSSYVSSVTTMRKAIPSLRSMGANPSWAMSHFASGAAWALAWSVLSDAKSEYEITLGAGGVMLDNTEWRRGLRDRELPVTGQQRDIVMPAIEHVIGLSKSQIFPIHRLS